MEDRQVLIDGHFCSERVSQIIHAIQERFPEIVVQWAPPTQRKAGQAAFRIMHFPMGGEPYVIRLVKTEADFTAAVLKDLIAGDQRNGRVTYDEFAAAEEAAALVAKQRADDETAEMIDKMYYVFKSPLNTYKLDKDITVKEGIPFNAKGY